MSEGVFTIGFVAGASAVLIGQGLTEFVKLVAFAIQRTQNKENKDVGTQQTPTRKDHPEAW